MSKVIHYTLLTGEKVGIFFNEMNQTWVAISCVGPVRFKIYEELTKEELEEKLKDYQGLNDVVAPAYLRKLFSDYIDRTYPFDSATAAILEFEDLEDKELIAKDIFNFNKSLNKYFFRPYTDDFYYPYGVEVSKTQITEFLNNLKNEKRQRKGA